MTALSQVVLCPLLALSFLTAGSGRGAENGASQRPKDKIEVEDINGTENPRPRRSKKVGRAEVEYFNNQTIATVALPDVYRQGRNLISLRATITSPGQRPGEPDVQLIIYFPPDFTPLNGNPDLTIRYGQGQESTGPTVRNPQAMVNLRGSYAGLLGHIDYEQFRRMAQSKGVVVQLGEFKLALDEKRLAPLRDLLRAVGQ